MNCKDCKNDKCYQHILNPNKCIDYISEKTKNEWKEIQQNYKDWLIKIMLEINLVQDLPNFIEFLEFELKENPLVLFMSDSTIEDILNKIKRK